MSSGEKVGLGGEVVVGGSGWWQKGERKMKKRKKRSEVGKKREKSRGGTGCDMNDFYYCVGKMNHSIERERG